MTMIWLGLAVWMAALAIVLLLAGGVRRGDRLRARALDARMSGSDTAEFEERTAAPLTVARRTPGRRTRRATG
jgi:hypothetical protein